ncbi:hypothetical protein LBMAG42_37780 [Deltaproteobacteria bacterium]|nr:hypothetical protein LBMAG42_37780 [Deltaproteobacteria bacterium]
MAYNAKLPIVAQDNLFDFFRERVDSAARRQRAAVSQDTVYYVSQLLAEQAHREDDEASAPTLVEMRERAANSNFAESVTWWRRLGDHALIGLGFFREHLARRRISPGYYAEMGAGAYGTLSRLLRDPGVSMGDVFGEMSERFESCTEMIAEVREESRENNASDIVRLYDEWQSTGSARAAERLRQLGVVPVRFGGIA